MPLELMPHQAEDAPWMFRQKRCINGSDMGTGKEQPLDALILTPTGFVPLGELGIGDDIINSSGGTSYVVGIFPQGVKEVYRVNFSDGSSTECGIEHLWAVQTANHRRRNQGFKVKSLNELKDDLRQGLSRKWFIPIVAPIEFKEEEELPFDPYLIGAMIANGTLVGLSLRYSTADLDTAEQVRKSLPESLSLNKNDTRDYDYIVKGDGKTNPLKRYFKKKGLCVKSPEKFLPEEYKFSSVKSRIALLQGLMDGDGSTSRTTRGVHTEYSTSSFQLAKDVVFLINSLGGKATIAIREEPAYTHKGEKRIGLPHYRISVAFSEGIVPFRCGRKVEIYKPNVKYPPARAIESIEYIGKKECACIKTSASDSLYITNDCIVTHNTATAIKATRYALSECKGNRVLVVCPASLKLNWQHEIAMWWRNAPVTILEGSQDKRKRILAEYEKKNGFLIVNYEQIAAKKAKEGDAKESTFDLDFLIGCNFHVVIADEAHVLRNRKTLAYKGMTCLAYPAKYLFLMTGTPIFNRITDMWTLLHLIDKNKFSSYWRFVDHPVWGCGKEKGIYGWKTGDKSKNPEAFKRMLAPYFCRRLKQDVLKDLPEKTTQRLWIDLNPAEAKVYREMEAEWLANLRGGQQIAAPVVISQITRMKQFCVSPDLAIMPLEDKARYGHGWKTAKFQALLELLESTDQKIVVFSQFEKAITLLQDMCQHHEIGMVRHTGAENARKRDEAIQAFKTDRGIQVMGLTTQSGGLGLNLTESSIAVFLDKMWVPAQNEQAAARIHRKGQKEHCIVYELLIKGSIESWLVEEKLQNKQDLIKEIIKMADERVKVSEK